MLQQARCRAAIAGLSLISGLFSRAATPICGALQYYYCMSGAAPAPRFHPAPRIR
jgi:hypothetical protein